jgi:hypothetical protein
MKGVRGKKGEAIRREKGCNKRNGLKGQEV